MLFLQIYCQRTPFHLHTSGNMRAHQLLTHTCEVQRKHNNNNNNKQRKLYAFHRPAKTYEHVALPTTLRLLFQLQRFVTTNTLLSSSKDKRAKAYVSEMLPYDINLCKCVCVCVATKRNSITTLACNDNKNKKKQPQEQQQYQIQLQIHT